MSHLAPLPISLVSATVVVQGVRLFAMKRAADPRAPRCVARPLRKVARGGDGDEMVDDGLDADAAYQAAHAAACRRGDAAASNESQLVSSDDDQDALLDHSGLPFGPLRYTPAPPADVVAPRPEPDFSDARPMGPPDLDASFDWALDNVENIAHVDERLGTNMRRNLAQGVHKGIVVTSNFSGWSTEAFAASEVFRQVSQACKPGGALYSNSQGLEGSQKGFVVYSTCDIMPCARLAAASRTSASRAMHQFADVLDRLFPKDRAEVEDIESYWLGQYDALKNSYLHQGEQSIDGLDGMDASTFMELKNDMGLQYIAQLKSKFKDFEFQIEGPCLRHGCNCLYSPRSDPRCDSLRWIECGNELPSVVRSWSTQRFPQQGGASYEEVEWTVRSPPPGGVERTAHSTSS